MKNRYEIFKLLDEKKDFCLNADVFYDFIYSEIFDDDPDLVTYLRDNGFVNADDEVILPAGTKLTYKGVSNPGGMGYIYFKLNDYDISDIAFNTDFHHNKDLFKAIGLDIELEEGLIPDQIIGDINLNLDAGGQSVGFLGGTGGAVTNNNSSTDSPLSVGSTNSKEPEAELKEDVVETITEWEVIYCEGDGYEKEKQFETEKAARKFFDELTKDESTHYAYLREVSYKEDLSDQEITELDSYVGEDDIHESLNEAPDKYGLPTDDELADEEERERAELEKRLAAKRAQRDAEKKAAADKEEADKKAAQERDQRLASVKDKVEEIKALVAKETEDTLFENLFNVLVPDRGPAETLAGELIRAWMRVMYRSWNDGDVFFEGYGLETCGPEAAFVCENANEEISKMIRDLAEECCDEAAQKEVGSSYRNYDDKCKEISQKLADSILSDYAETLVTKNTFDCNKDFDGADYWSSYIPKYEYELYIPDEVQKHVEAYNISIRDIISEVENWLNYENIFYGARVDSGWNDTILISDLTLDGYREIESWDSHNHIWNEYIEELNNEYGDPDEYDRDYDEEEYEDDYDESLNEAKEYPDYDLYVHFDDNDDIEADAFEKYFPKEFSKTSFKDEESAISAANKLNRFINQHLDNEHFKGFEGVYVVKIWVREDQEFQTELIYKTNNEIDENLVEDDETENNSNLAEKAIDILKQNNFDPELMKLGNHPNRVKIYFNTAEKERARAVLKENGIILGTSVRSGIIYDLILASEKPKRGSSYASHVIKAIKEATGRKPTFKYNNPSNVKLQYCLWDLGTNIDMFTMDWDAFYKIREKFEEILKEYEAKGYVRDYYLPDGGSTVRASFDIYCYKGSVKESINERIDNIDPIEDDDYEELSYKGKVAKRSQLDLMDSQEEYIYLFPICGAMEPISDCEDFNLTLLGKNYFEEEKNYVVKGSREDLEAYADYLGYELHPDYLYVADEFAGDIVKLNESSSNDHIEYKGVDITVQHEGNLEEGEAGAYYFNLDGQEYCCDYIEDCYKVIDAELSDGAGARTWGSIYLNESDKDPERINEYYVDASDGWVELDSWNQAARNFDDLDYEIKNCVKSVASDYKGLANEIRELSRDLDDVADDYEQIEEREYETELTESKDYYQPDRELVGYVIVDTEPFMYGKYWGQGWEKKALADLNNPEGIFNDEFYESIMTDDLDEAEVYGSVEDALSAIEENIDGYGVCIVKREGKNSIKIDWTGTDEPNQYFTYKVKPLYHYTQSWNELDEKLKERKDKTLDETLDGINKIKPVVDTLLNPQVVEDLAEENKLESPFNKFYRPMTEEDMMEYAGMTFEEIGSPVEEADDNFTSLGWYIAKDEYFNNMTNIYSYLSDSGIEIAELVKEKGKEKPFLAYTVNNRIFPITKDELQYLFWDDELEEALPVNTVQQEQPQKEEPALCPKCGASFDEEGKCPECTKPDAELIEAKSDNKFEVLYYTELDDDEQYAGDPVTVEFDTRKEAIAFYKKHFKDADKYGWWITERDEDWEVVRDIIVEGKLTSEEALKENKVKGFTREEAQQYARDLSKITYERGSYVDVDLMYNGDECCLYAYIEDGDWKHDHLAFEHTVRRYFMEKNIEVKINGEVVDSEDTFSDCYSVSYEIKKVK